MHAAEPRGSHWGRALLDHICVNSAVAKHRRRSVQCGKRAGPSAPQGSRPRKERESGDPCREAAAGSQGH